MSLSISFRLFYKAITQRQKEKFRQVHELKTWRACIMKSNWIIKSLMRIPDSYFWSDQCVDSQENLMKLFENFGTNLVKFAQISKRFHHRCLVGSLPIWISRNMVLAKIWNSKSKTILKINREWKYNLRDVEDPVKYLWWSFFAKIVNSL